MRLPFCEKCKINDKCEKDYDLFEKITKNKRIPPEDFCKKQHLKNNVQFENFYVNTIINNSENIKHLKFLFPELSENIDIIQKELENKNENIENIENIENKNEELTRCVTLMLTEKCNLACEYCYERFSGNLTAKSMSKETIINTVDYFFNDYIIKNKYMKVVWDLIGGEVFVEFEQLKFTVDYIIKKYIENNLCPRKFCSISLCSNGTMFTNEIKEWCSIIQNKISYLGIGLSLDGIKECHDLCRNNSFDKIMNIFDWWKETFPYDTIKGTISPKTLKYLFKNIEFYVDKLKLKEFYINPTFEGPWTDENSELYFEELVKCADFFNKKYPDYDILEKSNLFMNLTFNHLNVKRQSNWCGSGIYMRAVDPKGDIYPCLRAITSNYEPLGNINKEKKINKNILIPFYFYTSHNEETACDNCSIHSWCPTCVMQWYESTKDIFIRSTSLCTMTKMRYFASKYFIENSKLYIKYL